MIERTFLLSAILLTTCACGSSEGSAESFSIGGRQYSDAELTQFLLPRQLREISGLAFDPQQRLYAHDDERAIVYQIDHVSGRIIDQFELEGGVRDDFEGIAATGTHIYLVNSKGTLYEAAPGSGGAEVSYTRYKARLPCEVEGLVHDPAGERLIVACKNLHDAPAEIALQLHVWSIEKKSYLEEASISVAQMALESLGIGPGRIQATGVELTPSGNFLILAGRAHLLLEISPAGRPLSSTYLPLAGHPQAEGIALSVSGELLIADEAGSRGGQQKNGGRLSVYQPTE